MQDTFISIDDLQKNLIEIKEHAKQLTQKLLLTRQYLKYIFTRIKTCISLDEASYYFDVLAKIQEALAIIIFREEIGIADDLSLFVRDFDRIDDRETREFFYRKIVNGQCCYGMDIRKT